MRLSNLVAAAIALSLVAVASALAGYDPVVGGGIGLITAMAVVQSAYSANIPAGAAGMPATMTGYDVDTVVCETAAGIGFGLAVGQGTAANGGVLGGALALFRGVSLRDPTLVNTVGDEYQQYDSMGVGWRGDFWVSPVSDVLITDPVHYDATTGRFQASGGSGPIVGARWMRAASADGLAIVRLTGNLPVP